MAYKNRFLSWSGVFRPAVFVCAGLVILLGGCQSVQDVSLKKLSDNTYQVTAADETDQLANGSALAMASQFCQRLGAQNQTVSGNALVEQGVHHFVLVFHCV
jgi:hypothetical protein